MKILVVSNMYPDQKHPSSGTFVKNFCEQLESIGVDFDISVMTQKNSTRTKILGYFIFYFSTFFKCMFGKYELVYIHYPSYSSFPVLLAQKLRTFPVYVNVHGSDVIPLKPNHEKMHKFTEMALNSAIRIIVPSEYFKDVVVNKYGLDRAKVFIYPSAGVDPNIFKQLSKETITSLKIERGMPLDIPVIGFVSRITIEKGWDTFLKAAKKVSKSGYKCTFLMVGSGKDDLKVTQMIKEMHLESKIIRYPQMSQGKLAEIFNICDFFVFPTAAAAESLGLVAIEAMACGCPVIASDYAAPGRYVKDGVNGKKFPKGDDEMLARCLIECLESNCNQQQLLQNGALMTATKYSTDNIQIILSKIMFQ